MFLKVWTATAAVALFGVNAADDIQVAKCDVSIKNTGISMPTFLIPSEDLESFKTAVANAETEMRTEAASLLQQARDEERGAFQALVELQFVMRCHSAPLKEFEERCEICNYQESPTENHLIQGTVIGSDLEACITGKFENRSGPSQNYHPTCFPVLPDSLLTRSDRETAEKRTMLTGRHSRDGRLAQKAATGIGAQLQEMGQRLVEVGLFE